MLSELESSQRDARDTVRVPGQCHISQPAGLRIDFNCPEEPRGIVLCVFDSEPDVDVVIARQCTEALLSANLAVLTLQCPTPHTDKTSEVRERALFLGLNEALQWLTGRVETAVLPMGIWACGTCVVPALMLAAQHGERIDAAACCGGRPELTPVSVLHTLKAPTLLLVDLEDACTLEAEERTTAMRPRALRIEHIALKPDDSTSDSTTNSTGQRIANLSAHWMYRYLVYPPVWSLLGKG